MEPPLSVVVASPSKKPAQRVNLSVKQMQPDSGFPSPDQVVKKMANVHQKKRRSSRPYFSSTIMEAYTKFKHLEQSALSRKQDQFENEAKRREAIEITDAGNLRYLRGGSDRNSPAEQLRPSKMYNFIGSAKASLDRDRVVSSLQRSSIAPSASQTNMQRALGGTDLLNRRDKTGSVLQ